VRSERCKAVIFSREAVTFFCKAVAFSREAVTFFCKAVMFSREAVAFYLSLLTSPLSLLIMDSLTGKHLTHVAHVAPNCGWGRIPMRSGPPLSPPLSGGAPLCWFGGTRSLGVGWATWVGCFPFSLTYARVREKTLTAHP